MRTGTEAVIAEAIDMTGAWEILARRHEAPSVANVMRLEREFVSCKMSPIESVEKFIISEIESPRTPCSRG